MKMNSHQNQTLLDIPSGATGSVDLGRGFSVDIIGTIIVLYASGKEIKTIDKKDKTSFRILIIELVEAEIKHVTLWKAFNISRQTIHNWVQVKKKWGLQGLGNSYPTNRKSRKKSIEKKAPIDTTENSFSQKTESQLHDIGNKARILEELRRSEREKQEINENEELMFTFEAAPNKEIQQPYNKEHDWEATRYAGVFIYIIILISQWKWMKLIQYFLGNSYKIMMVFIIMAAKNIRSIEQLKNIRTREAGIILGIDRILSRPIVWKWFYTAAQIKKSTKIMTSYFSYQLQVGLVGTWLWFTDGHLLPYTGKKKVHYSYSTQRQQPVPGQTNFVTTDEDGRIVSFNIQEGKGNLKERIQSTIEERKKYLSNKPVMIFDREGYAYSFFFDLQKKHIPFCCWDKYVDSEKMKAIENHKYTTIFEMNGKEYGVFEGEKEASFTDSENKDKTVTLKVVYLWNKTTNKRTCGIYSGGGLSVREAAEAILSRWGASENTFKHIQNRHPFHYHPGFKVSKSDKQSIENPILKKVKTTITTIKKSLHKLYIQLAKLKKPINNQDGSDRKNSIHNRIQTQIDNKETELHTVKETYASVPKRIDVTTLEEYTEFNQIDNEGKNLFDFVTTSIWNARKLLVSQIRDGWTKELDAVDLFYAITACHGWIKCDKKSVSVILEPMEIPRRLAAQKKLCSYLTSLGASLPNGKFLSIQVDVNPKSRKKTNLK